jgi:hypothetical protein
LFFDIARFGESEIVILLSFMVGARSGIGGRARSAGGRRTAASLLLFPKVTVTIVARELAAYGGRMASVNTRAEYC